MVNEYYSFVDAKNHTIFSFKSKGIQGEITKIVLFSLDANNRWNLGFGDWQNGFVNDKIVTNNHDTFELKLKSNHGKKYVI